MGSKIYKTKNGKKIVVLKYRVPIYKLATKVVDKNKNKYKRAKAKREAKKQIEEEML